MNQDYFINDDNQNNWVTLAKPLSSYTQEELAEQLINNKHETMSDQKVIIDGKIGATLSTNGFDTPEEFLDRYRSILDRAGFKKNSDVSKVEEATPLTVKPKALSKVSFLDYTQEELAHLIMDDKIKNNDGTEYGVYQHRETVFDSIGCDTIDDFLAKYQEKFKQMLIKPEKKEEIVLPKIEVPNEIKVMPSNLTDNGIRVITVPLGMFEYSQEQLAHLVMDNKWDDEIVGVRVKNGVILDSTDCNTVEDFIAKNEKVATELGIKHDFSEKIEAPGNIVEDISNYGEIPLDTIVDLPRVEVDTNAITPTVEKVKDFNVVGKTSLVPLLLDMMVAKKTKKIDVRAKYKDLELSTENCETFKDLVTKYDGYIADEKYEEWNKLLKNKELEKAKFLFEIPRGNYYNGTEAAEEPKLDIIRQKNNEYVKLISEKDNIDFNNPDAVVVWLDKLVPYINTHALNLNLGINASTLPADKYLLEIMAEKGYNTDIFNADNMDSYSKYKITNKLCELEKYHFFISDYEKLSDEDKMLNSAKTQAMAEIAYLNTRIEEGQRGLELVKTSIENNRLNTELSVTELTRRIDVIEAKLNDSEEVDTSFDDKVETEEEKNVVEVYKKATRVKASITEIQEAMTLIDGLPEDSKIKENLRRSIYNLFIIHDNNNKDMQEEIANYYNEQGAVDSKVFSYSDEVLGLLKEKDLCVARMAEIKDNSVSCEQRLVAKEEKLNELITSKKAQLAELRAEYNLENYLQETVEKKEEIKPEKKETNADFIKKLENIAKEDIFVDSERVDSKHDYLSTANAGNLGLIDNVEGPKEEIVSNIDFNGIEEPIVAPVVEKTELEYDFSLSDDQFELTLADNEDSLKDFVPIKSFKKITKKLYDKINALKIKDVIKKAVEVLGANKKAALRYAGFVAAIAVAAVAAKGNIDTKLDVPSMAMESTMESDDEAKDEAEVDTVIPTSDVSTDNYSYTEANADEEEYKISLDEAASKSINDILEGNNSVYASSNDATNAQNGIDINNLYKPSWENATTGDYFVEKDGTMSKVSQEEAEDYYQNGQSVVQSVENDGTVIGYVNVESADSVKSM